MQLQLYVCSVCAHVHVWVCVFGTYCSYSMFIKIILHIIAISFIMLHSISMALAVFIIQILRSVLLVLTIVLNCAWSWMEDMSVIALMDISQKMMELLVKVDNNMAILAMQLAYYCNLLNLKGLLLYMCNVCVYVCVCVCAFVIYISTGLLKLFYNYYLLQLLHGRFDTSFDMRA